MRISNGRAGKFWQALGFGLVSLFLVAGCGSGGDPAEHFARANEYRQAGDIEAAVIELKNVLRADPNHAEARWMLGNLYLKTGESDAAVKELSKALELGIRDAEKEYPLVEAYLMNQRFSEALNVLEDEEPSPTVHVLRGRALLGLGEQEEASEAFQEALNQDASNSNALLGLARIHLARGELDDALDRANAALAIEALPRAWLLKAEVLFLLKRFDEALPAYQEAKADNRLKIPAALGGARIHIVQSRFESAGRELEGVLSQVPEHPLANYLQAILYDQAKKLDEAKLALETTFKYNPDYPPALLLMGSILYRKERFEQADSYLTKLVAQVPDHVVGRKLLASTKMKLGETARVVEILQPVVTEASDDVELLSIMGSALLASGDAERGTRFLERASEINPASAPIKTQLALSKLQQGDLEQGIQELEVAVALENPPEIANSLLVAHHLRNGDIQQALEVTQKLIDKEPDNPLYYNLQGAAYIKLEEFDKARDTYLTALEKNPGYHPAALNLANLALRADDAALARSYLEGILGKDPYHEQALINLAKLEQAQGNSGQVLTLLEKAREGNPRALQSRVLLASHYLHTGNLEQAQRIIDEAKKHHQNVAGVQLLEAQVASARGDRGRAIDILEAYLQRDPENLAFLLLLGTAYQAEELWDKSEVVFDRILAKDEKYLPALRGKFQIEYVRGDHAAAQTLAERIKALNPQSAEADVLMGDLYRKAGRHQEAREHYLAAEQIRPSSPLVVKRFQLEKDSGNVTAAEKILTEWLTDQPEDVAIRLLYASSLQQRGRLQDAVGSYQAALDAHPDNVGALNNLAWVYHELGDRERALRLAERAYQLAPERGEVVDTYGWLLLSRDKKSALSYLRQAAQLMPDSLDVQFHLARALYENGKTSDAVSLLTEILAAEPAGFSEREKAQALLDELR